MKILRSTCRQPYLTPSHSVPLIVQDPMSGPTSFLDVRVDPTLRAFASPVATRTRIDRGDTRLIGMRSREISAPGCAPITRWNGRRIETVCVRQVEHSDWLFQIKDISVGRGEFTWVQTPRWVLEAAEKEGLPIRARIPLTKRFGQWIGIYLSDGWAQHRRGILNSIGLANKADEVREAALVGLEDILEPGADIPRYSERLRDSLTSGWTVELQVKSPALALLLDWLIGHDAKHKHLPQFTLLAPREFREGVFGAGMSCDGGINFCWDFEAHNTATWGAQFTTTSPKVASEWLALGGSLGLTGWICEHRRKKKKKKRPEFTVGFRHEHIWSSAGH